MARRMPAARVAAISAANLPHTCTISWREQARDDADAPAFDGGGESEVNTYPNVATGVPCSARQGTGQGEATDGDRDLVAQTWRVRLAVGTAIGTDDQISHVRNDAGVSIVDGPLTVTELLYRTGHTLAVCTAAALAGPVSVEEAGP